IRLELPDGQKLFFKPRPSGDCNTGSVVDRSDLDRMPALAVAYQRESVGEGAARINNRPAIQAGVAAHNQAAQKAIQEDDRRFHRSGWSCALGGLGGGPALVLLAVLALLAR